MTANPPAVSIGAAGGSGQLQVDTARECSWSVSTSESWLSLTPASGQGPAPVNYDVSANPTAGARTGTVAIGDQRIQITQSGQQCAFALPTREEVIGATGGDLRVTVSTPQGCSWTAVSQVSWVTIANQTVDSVVLRVDQNSGPQRTGLVMIADLAFQVRQAEGSAACNYDVSPRSQSAPSGGGTTTWTVATAANCSWVATSATSWLTITGGANAIGPGSVVVGVDPNSGAARVGTLTIAGSTVDVQQAEAPRTCSYSASPRSVTLPAGGGSAAVSVTATAGCPWAATSSAQWLQIRNTAGTGNDTVTLSAEGNPTSSARQTIATVAGQSVTVLQSGAAAPAPAPGCTYSITPTSDSIPPAATSRTINVTAGPGCDWTAASTLNWITVTGGSTGTGPGTVILSVAANAATSARTGTVTIAGTTYTLTQAGAACTYSIAPIADTALAAGATKTVDVTAGTGCSWTATTTENWITVTGGSTGTGSGPVTLLVATNPATSARTGTVMIAGATYTLTQAGRPCSYTIAPPTDTAPAGGTTKTVDVTAAPGCGWTATTTENWITVTGGNSGNGSGTVTLSVAANPGTSARSGTVTIAGTTYTLTQAACSYTIAPTSDTATGGSTTKTVDVTASPGCGWTAATTENWITIAGGSTGTGSGTVTLSVAANQGTSSRTGTATIAGTIYTLTQAACSYAIAPTRDTAPPAGATKTVNVTADTGCGWTASTTQNWITITGGSTGAGSGTVTLSVAVNPSGAARTGTVTIAGTPYTLTQDTALVTVSGNVSSLSGTCPNVTFVVNGETITASSSTLYIHGSCEKLDQGRGVIVRGMRASDGKIQPIDVEFN